MIVLGIDSNVEILIDSHSQDLESIMTGTCLE